MSEKIVFAGIVCDECLREGRLEDAAISHWEQLLDGTSVEYCDNGHVRHGGQRLHHVVGKEKIGCTIKFSDLFGSDGRPVIERMQCYPLADRDGKLIREKFECDKCPSLEMYGYKGTMKLMYQKVTKPIRGKDAEGVDPKKLLHRHSGFGMHPLSRKHKRQPDKRDRRFENYAEFLKWLKWFKGIEVNGGK